MYFVCGAGCTTGLALVTHQEKSFQKHSAAILSSPRSAEWVVSEATTEGVHSGSLCEIHWSKWNNLHIMLPSKNTTQLLKGGEVDLMWKPSLAGFITQRCFDFMTWWRLAMTRRDPGTEHRTRLWCYFEGDMVLPWWGGRFPPLTSYWKICPMFQKLTRF